MVGRTVAEHGRTARCFIAAGRGLVQRRQVPRRGNRLLQRLDLRFRLVPGKLALVDRRIEKDVLVRSDAQDVAVIEHDNDDPVVTGDDPVVHKDRHMRCKRTVFAVGVCDVDLTRLL